MTPDDDAWSGERVTRWLAQSAGLERQLQPVSDVLFAAADLRNGERVLDVGCGHGPTTRRAAELVGSTGSVVGLDISAEMLAAARARTVESVADPAPIEWLRADPSASEIAVEAVDVVLSRFGVMFFDDPLRSFENLASATRPGGRLCVATWARRDESELFEVPYATARQVLQASGRTAEEPPLDEGPFSMWGVEVVEPLLTNAGWTDVTVTPHDLALRPGGGVPPESAARGALEFGPTRLVVDGHDDLHDAVRKAIEETYLERFGSDGPVELVGRVNVVTARRD